MKFLSENKYNLVLSLVIAAIISFYFYKIEDKNEIFKSSITLPKQQSFYNNILRNSVLTISSIINQSAKEKCQIGVTTDAEFIIGMTISYNYDYNDKNNYFKNAKKNCKKILERSFAEYIKFNQGVLKYLNNSVENNLDFNQNNEQFLVSQRIYFLNHIFDQINENEIQFKQTYSPSEINDHIINFIIICILLSATLIGLKLSILDKYKKPIKSNKKH